MYEVGFLGLGKMGTSIAEGILAKGIYQKDNLGFYAPSEKTKEKGLGMGLSLCVDERDLVNKSKMVILAIEPQKYGEVLSKLKGIDAKGKVIVSLAPGKTIAYLKSFFPESRTVRAMPNTPSLINKGVTTLAFDGEEIKEVVDVFASIGTYEVILEEQIDQAIPLQGSMPAYLFEFVKSFVDTAVSHGLDKDQARKLALNAIIGSCELALQRGDDLDALIDSVCSRGGATIAGLMKMRECGFDKAIKEGYEACVARSIELGGDK